MVKGGKRSLSGGGALNGKEASGNRSEGGEWEGAGRSKTLESKRLQGSVQYTVLNIATAGSLWEIP